MHYNKKKRVLVAMSGGIDSAVAAVMLYEAGYEVVGITMKTWDYATNSNTHKKKEIGCCSLDAINDARNIAVELGFPHIVVDIREEFGKHVVNFFKSEYLAGKTPNPCVLCNTHIKWDALLERANQLNCNYLATGHYAKIRKEDNRYIVSKGVDLNKDQSYALWGVSQESLKRTLLPLGDLTKSQIRAFTKKKGFKDLLNKPESYEICFIPDNDYRGFLKRNIPGLKEQVAGGEFVLDNGKVVGHHEGYPFYTVGQRKGLKLSLGYPVYVTEIHKETNRIVVGTFDELSRDGMYVHRLNMLKYANLQGKKIDAITKIRYNDVGTASVIEQDGNYMKVFFGKGVYAITPGQAAVFYEGDDLIGGGWIETAFKQKTAELA